MAVTYSSSNATIQTTTATLLSSPAGTTSIFWRPNFAPGSGKKQYLFQFALTSTGSETFTAQHFTDNNFYIGWSQSGDQRVIFADTALFSSNTWLNIVTTYTSSGTNVFFGGSTTASTATSPVTTSASSNKVLTISNGIDIAGGAGHGLNTAGGGSFADFAYWNVALSKLEISAIANGVRPYTIRSTALLGYWPLDGIQSPEPDLSGNKKNATLTSISKASIGAPFGQFTPRWPIITIASTVVVVSSFIPARAMRANLAYTGYPTM